MNRVRLAFHQFKYDIREYNREPIAIFFSAFLPVMFLVLFVSVFGNERIPLGGGRFVSGATYFVPSILALGVISATATNLSISVSVARERGILKRLLATPLPPSTFLVGRVMTQLVTVTGIAALTITIGRVAYNVWLPPAAWPALLLTLVVGIFCFCCVGFLMTLLIKSEASAPAVANAFVLPLQFISGVFFPRGTIPPWMRNVAGYFPIRHLVDAILTVFDPRGAGSRVAGGDLLVMLVWGLASLVVAARFFRWAPTTR